MSYCDKGLLEERENTLYILHKKAHRYIDIFSL